MPNMFGYVVVADGWVCTYPMLTNHTIAYMLQHTSWSWLAISKSKITGYNII